MTKVNFDLAPRGRTASWLARGIVAVVTAGVLSAAGTVGAASAPVLRSASFKGYTNALVNGSGKTLYALTACVLIK
jgi:hypothetical protein